MVEGEKVEDVFSMVDVLTAKLSARLGLSSPAGEGRLLRVADVTTNSFEAYKYYQKGREHSWRREFVEAVNNYRNALAIDSTFALAYLYWAREGNNTIDPLVDLSHVQRILQQAERHSARASVKEHGIAAGYC